MKRQPKNKKQRLPRREKKRFIKKYGRSEYRYQYGLFNFPGLPIIGKIFDNKFSR